MFVSFLGPTLRNVLKRLDTMPTHWGYAKFEATDDLEQGDFLIPTEELRSVLNLVHPHFCDNKYTGYLVITQSCDLVRRDGDLAKARYVNIATVRPLQLILYQLLATRCESVCGAFLKSGWREAWELLERITNQNENTLGLFYLHPDSDLEFASASVAFLRVSIALRADHYEILMNARRGRLKPDFQAKLGWLVGNLYARPASRDWADSEDGKNGQSDAIHDVLKNAGITWFEDEKVALAKAKGFDFTSVQPNGIKAALRPYVPTPPMTEGCQIVEKYVREYFTKYVPIPEPQQDVQPLENGPSTKRPRPTFNFYKDIRRLISALRGDTRFQTLLSKENDGDKDDLET